MNSLVVNETTTSPDILFIRDAEKLMSEMICYCFGYSEADIEADLIRNKGRSAILEKIIENRKSGSCRCETMHPEKR